MKDLSDTELIELVKSDNEEAKEELYRRCKEVISYSVRVHRLRCWKATRFDVEDIVSECHIALMEATKFYDSSRGASFPHYLKFVIRRRLYNYIENRIEDSKNVVRGARLDLIKAPEDFRRDLTIKCRTAKEKAIVELYLAGMIQSDIAKELNVTKGWISQTIKRCIK